MDSPKVQSAIISRVTARQIYSERGYPCVEARVETECGAVGVGVATAGISVGQYEAVVVWDHGEKWRGKGVSKAVQNVEDVIGPHLVGRDTTRQREVDGLILELDGTPNKQRLGANATGSVSGAVLRAGAHALGIPLYQHIHEQSGTGRGYVMPVPSVTTAMGGRRYGGSAVGGTKPTYSLVCHDFDRYSDAIYAGWSTARRYFELLWERFQIESWHGCGMLPPGVIEHDRQLWELMLQAVKSSGYQGRIGLQVDVAANTYFDRERDCFRGLFSRSEKSRDDLVRLYREMVSEYGFVVVEDPLNETDFEGHAQLTRDLGIQIVGDDLFSTNIRLLEKGIDAEAANGVVLKVNQVGTMTEAFDAVSLAHANDYRVLPCKSRGEGVEIADYAVGLCTGQIREEDTVGGVTNRLLEIEQELGNAARFLGSEALAWGGKEHAPNTAPSRGTNPHNPL